MKAQVFSVARLAAISDGVFAIAMTLLVLDLKLPEGMSQADPALFIRVLKGQLPHFVSWIISFAILTRLWITQHAIFGELTEESAVFTWLNFAFLAAVSFIPFPTSLISEYGRQPLAVIVFSVVVVFCSLMLGLMCMVRGQSGGKPIGLKELHPSAKHILVGVPLVGLITCLLAYWKPVAGSIVWIVMPFLGITIRQRRRNQSKPKTYKV